MGSSSVIAPTSARSIQRSLLTWYDENKRDLPWRRRAGDPYAQWVAEIMLQQTRVETVMPYYLRFMDRFPDVEKLARARHESVLKHWEGLGYYRRALLLHEGAKQVRASGGVMPESAETLQEVSGIGDYTAAAIASIAFGEPAAAVDGNVCRVVARLFAIEENILTNRGRSAVKHFAEQLLPHDRPGDFNQAWMDLGSSICTPKTPRCLLCPLKEHCRSFAEGRVAEFPVRESKTIVKDEALLVLLLICNGEYLVRRRPRGGLWSGLWEFPNVVTTPAASTKPVNRKPKGGQAAQRRAAQALPGDEAAALLTSMGMQADDAGRPEDFECLGEVTHQLSHRNLSFSVWRGELSAGFEPEDTAYRWVSPAAFAKLSVSTAHRKIWKLVDNL